MSITDKYGRTFKTLRVSLTNHCNLGCVYCVHSEGKKNSFPNSFQKTLDYTELLSIIEKINSLSPLHTIRITGGEPTLYKDLIPFVKQLATLGIPDIKMTSNGYLLEDMLPKLSEAGLKKINISLDAISNERFQQVSGRKHLDKILATIEKALEYAIEIKINAVVLKGINDDQVLPLLQFSKDRNIPIRFLELMRMGPLYQNNTFDDYFISENELLAIISKQYQFAPLPRKPSATANYWATPDGYAFGIIANESHPFCQDCDRLRLDSYGNIYGCLSNATAIPVSDMLDDDTNMRMKLATALSQKQELKFTGSKLSMMHIGG